MSTNGGKGRLHELDGGIWVKTEREQKIPTSFLDYGKCIRDATIKDRFQWYRGCYDSKDTFRTFSKPRNFGTTGLG